jgi:formate hydrogenlyase subunit 6/NADH:ubiquinone oxidoreductase subunit I
MRIGAMLGDISRSLFKRPVTERYPFERKAAPERLRGQLTFDPSKCTGCKICVRDCPAHGIEIMVVDKVAKRFVLRFHTDRCTYCAQCVVSCNFDALGMSHEQWELAALSREPFSVSFGREEDVQALLDQASCKPAAPTAPVIPVVPAAT